MNKQEAKQPAFSIEIIFNNNEITEFVDKLQPCIQYMTARFHVNYTDLFAFQKDKKAMYLFHIEKNELR